MRCFLVSRYTFLLVLLLFLPKLVAFSQYFENELEKLSTLKEHPREVLQVESSKKKSFFAKYNPIAFTFNALLTGYQKVVSPQIGANCLYETTCSRFSRQAIAQFGLIKGGLLTADRLSRCNRLSAATRPIVWLNSSGKVVENPQHFSHKWYKQNSFYH